MNIFRISFVLVMKSSLFKVWVAHTFTILSHSHNFCLEFELMANKTECVALRDVEQSQGKKLDAVECANACHRLSSLFVYGRTSTSACDAVYGCECYCESSTDENGECLETRVNNDYDLYRYTTSINMGETHLQLKMAPLKFLI